jgi:hypothetical protein
MRIPRNLDRPAAMNQGCACGNVPVHPSTSIPKRAGDPLANGFGVEVSGENSPGWPMPEHAVTCLRHLPPSRRAHLPIRGPAELDPTSELRLLPSLELALLDIVIIDKSVDKHAVVQHKDSSCIVDHYGES